MSDSIDKIGNSDQKSHDPRSRRSRKAQSLSANAASFTPAVTTSEGSTAATQTEEGKKKSGNRRGRNGPRRGGQRARDGRTLPQPSSDQLSDADRVNAVAQVSKAQSSALVSEVKEAETIMERLQQALAKNLYECCICCDIIKRHQPVYEDQQCWAVFHLSCITKWAKRALSPETGDAQETWRCPACNSRNGELPGQYSCWCTKQLQPEPSRTAPHSCGQTCGKSRGGDCPHPCSLPCHPGPCAPCTSMGPQQRCFCGKNSTQRRCIDTNYEMGAWACQEVCNEVLPCDEHSCQRRCHPGLCGACTVLEQASCYCGKEVKQIACSSKEESQTGVNGSDETITGCWKCANRCERYFDCQEHKCQRSCHVKTSTISQRCPLAPELVTTCHCGQTKIDSILPTARSSCCDPIPSCGKTCMQSLPCGHQCQSQCHEGACPECTIEMDVRCQCGSTSVSTTCQDMQLGLQPSCERQCRSALSCSRHICPNRCCSGLPLAQARIARRPKGRQAAQYAARQEEIEAEHFCTKPCGKVLTCGNHSCGVMCHSGPCPSCLVASFDDLTCHCGRTAIAAPVACGTRPPSCSHPCTRTPVCGHPAVPHTCHMDDEACPRCPYLVSRLCMCGKSVVKNQPCWKTVVSCGQVCERDLECGRHRCLKRCHAADECESPCLQKCGKARRGCGHPCIETCHGAECPEDSQHACTASVMATCACGNTKMAVRCNSQDSDPTKQPQRTLKCTEFCAITERNKKLSSALGVSSEQRNTAVVESVLYDSETLSYYKDNKIWCTSIEREFRLFVQSDEKIKNFKPMKRDLRKFIHEMAEVYQMKSESMDEEPKRSVQLLKTVHTDTPAKTLSLSATTVKSSAAAATPVLEQLEKQRRGQAFNALVLVALQFGLTKDELETHLLPPLTSSSATLLKEFEIEVTRDGDYAFLKPIVSTTTTPAGSLSTEAVEIELAKLKTEVKHVVVKASLATTVELCWILKNGEMAYRESSSKKSTLKSNLLSKSHTKTAATTKNAFAALSIDQA